MMIELKLTGDEVAALVLMLGNLPTASGAYPLMCKVRAQLHMAEERTRSQPISPALYEQYARCLHEYQLSPGQQAGLRDDAEFMRWYERETSPENTLEQTP